MGDRVAVPGPLVDIAMGDRVGLAFWDCVAMTRAVLPDVRRGSTVCTAMLRLADGDITLQGPDPAGFGASVFAVTGGTGLYRNGARRTSWMLPIPTARKSRSAWSRRPRPPVKRSEARLRGRQGEGGDNDG